MNLIKEKLLNDFYFFFKVFWHKTSAELFVESKHIEYICKELELLGKKIINKEPIDIDYLIINVPPGSSKSSIVSIMFPTWLLLNDPSLFIINSSFSNSLATKFIRKSKLILDSEAVADIFGKLDLTKDLENLIETKQGGGRLSTSVTGGVTGDHANLLIADDILSVQQASSKVFTDKASAYLFETLSTRKRDKKNTPIILMMQRLNENDPTAQVLARDFRIKHICLPSEISEISSNPELYTDGLLDPVRMNTEILLNFKKALGSYGYAGQFLQRPSPTEGGLIKKDWIKFYDISTIDVNEFDLCIDTAYTAKTTNDPTAIIKYQKKDNCIYVIEVYQIWFEFPALKRKIIEIANPNTKIFIEPKASGLSIIQQLRYETMLNIIEDAVPTLDKISRLNGVINFIESGRLLLPSEGLWQKNYINELVTFPNSAHDDQVDVTVSALNKLIHNSIEIY